MRPAMVLIDTAAALAADAGVVLRTWSAAGIRLAGFSALPVAEQQQALAGADVAGLFDRFFDTHVGGRREPDSYVRLAISIGIPPIEILFLTDDEDELDAAAAAGLRTCCLGAPAPDVAPRHPVALDFHAVAALAGLPQAS